jgi:hypothetical protein
VTTICKAMLSGGTPRQIRDRTQGLVPARLRDLAIQLAGHPDLTVCVITCDDGTQELEVLHTGPPHRTADTIDCRRFSRQSSGSPARTLSIASQADLQEAISLIRGIFLDAVP